MLWHIRNILRGVIGIPISLGQPQGGDYRAALHFIGEGDSDALASRRYQIQLIILPPDSAPPEARKRALAEFHRRLAGINRLAVSRPEWLDFAIDIQPIPEDASALEAMISVEVAR